MPIDQNGNPAPFPPVPGVLKVAFKFKSQTDLDIITNFHLSYSGGAPTPAALLAWLNSVDTLISTNLIPLFPATTSLIQYEATDLSSATAAQATISPAHVGTRTGTGLPISTAAVALGKIARRYRGGKPRNYWPFGTSTDLQDTAHFTTGAVTAFNSGVGTMFNGLLGSIAGTATIAQQVNVSYFKGFKMVTNPVTGRARNVAKLGPSPPYPYVDPLTFYGFNATLGSQRRRLRPG